MNRDNVTREIKKKYCLNLLLIHCPIFILWWDGRMCFRFGSGNRQKRQNGSKLKTTKKTNEDEDTTRHETKRLTEECLKGGSE